MMQNAATGSQSHDASIVGDGEDVVFRADDIERGLVDRAELPSAYTAARRSVSNSWRSIGGEPYFKHKMSEAEERSTTVDYADQYAEGEADQQCAVVHSRSGFHCLESV